MKSDRGREWNGDTWESYNLNILLHSNCTRPFNDSVSAVDTCAATRRRSMGLPLNQMVPNCAPNHLRLTALNKYRCVHHHHHRHHPVRRCPPAHRQALHVCPSADPPRRDSGSGLAYSRNSQIHRPSSVGHDNKQLLNKFRLNLAKSRLKLKELIPHRPSDGNHKPLSVLAKRSEVKIRSNINRIDYFRNSVPIVSNMPLINIQNSSILFINDSPFGLRDKRFGILHHFQPSETYYS